MSKPGEEGKEEAPHPPKKKKERNTRTHKIVQNTTKEKLQINESNYGIHLKCLRQFAIWGHHNGKLKQILNLFMIRA